MDQALTAFHDAANQENRHRPQRRRYSPARQQQALAYWQQRRDQEGVRTIAAALGISASTLQRWMRGGREPRRFRRVTVAASERSVSAPVVVTMTDRGPRVEGLTIETAARLLTLLR
jgi:transcriptional regulator with XRE-family HTH domain